MASTDSISALMPANPALELLVDDEGTVSGAPRVNRQTGDTWAMRTGAVVIATGGCVLLSKAPGCNVLTGDVQLMAAKVGAALSGMELASTHGLGPLFGDEVAVL